MGARRTAKRTKSREEWWRGPGGQPNALRAGRGGGGLHHYDIITVCEPQSLHLFSIGDATLREKERERERG